MENCNKITARRNTILRLKKAVREFFNENQATTRMHWGRSTRLRRYRLFRTSTHFYTVESRYLKGRRCPEKDNWRDPRWANSRPSPRRKDAENPHHGNGRANGRSLLIHRLRWRDQHNRFLWSCDDARPTKTKARRAGQPRDLTSRLPSSPAAFLSRLGAYLKPHGSVSVVWL